MGTQVSIIYENAFVSFIEKVFPCFGFEHVVCDVVILNTY